MSGGSTSAQGLTELRDLAEENALPIELLLHEACVGHIRRRAAGWSGDESDKPCQSHQEGGGRGHTL